MSKLTPDESNLIVYVNNGDGDIPRLKPVGTATYNDDGSLSIQLDAPFNGTNLAIMPDINSDNEEN